MLRSFSQRKRTGARGHPRGGEVPGTIPDIFVKSRDSGTRFVRSPSLIDGRTITWLSSRSGASLALRGCDMKDSFPTYGATQIFNEQVFRDAVLRLLDIGVDTA